LTKPPIIIVIINIRAKAEINLTDGTLIYLINKSETESLNLKPSQKATIQVARENASRKNPLAKLIIVDKKIIPKMAISAQFNPIKTMLSI
jgi:hypothetical protein